ncbi:translation initiation factor eIF-2B subunit delta [Penicillium macrosclerotiorum]|uniref:translation initiation factor eIF-2B subunit delta n=1 Tax=Penicillium macrosclerotiorum TaxID=303699 RepID=UPI0025469C6B|nr:translation initiation factor eIF-2B subunit delta [Penicillium macrosclerotiorum]KAJ5690089.1 translation initiation factor eIF-2B subunit delta [Penicillium macrosclerotiorum]
MSLQMRRRRLGLRRSVGRLWHHFFRDSTLSAPHQALQGLNSTPPLVLREIESYKMVDPVDPAPTSTSSAAPSAAQPIPATESASSSQTQNLPIRDSKSAKGPVPSDKHSATGKDPSKHAADAGDDKPLTPAELKKKAKAEKAARRAKERLEREGGAGAAGGSAPGSNGGHQTRSPVTPKKDAVGGGASQKGQRGAPQPRRGSGPLAQDAAAEQKKKKEDKKVAVFGHLYGQQRRTTVAGAGKEVHPAVLALGLQLRDYVVCGSSARCVATMLAFKRVVESYATPLGTSLSRHLTTHLSHQITYLSTCRPLSISQGNAIRALKLAISSVDPSTPEASAKATLCEFIDSFIREKITVADEVIAQSAAQKIQDGDVIVTFAGSSIVKQTLIKAHKQGKRFRVSIIDSRPLFEGKNLARALASVGLDIQYSLVHGISHAIKDATKVFLGAHAMTSNGRLYSRVGTALVAMSAKERAGGVEVPVIVCCETVKFTDRVALDSIVVNEIADADELVSSVLPQQVTGLPDPAAHTPAPADNKKGGKGAALAPTPDPSASRNASTSPLAKWKDTPNLQLLNIMYDVTPAEYVDMVVTEMGSLPPSAVPIVHRMSTNM